MSADSPSASVADASASAKRVLKPLTPFSGCYEPPASTPFMSPVLSREENNDFLGRADGDGLGAEPQKVAPEECQWRRSARATQRITAIGEMTGGIAHDFRNVLAIVASGLSMAEKNADDSDKVRTLLAGVRETACI
jgi:hypothetical protein